jgi:4a-hydroxytetrahydrobiopterin dehydratase
MAALTRQQIAAEQLTGWAQILDRLATRVPVPAFSRGLTLVNAIAAAAQEADHHPEIDLRYAYVDIRLTSYDSNGVTARDIRMARTISALVAQAGLVQDATAVQGVEFALDTPSRSPELARFWAAVLGSAVRPQPLEVAEQYNSHLTLWFQKSGSEEPRQHWHPDIWVDPAQVQPRIDAALEAGGTLVSDRDAPSFWILADQEGNKVCLCTWQER